jgi:hypothetical protein
MGLRRWPYRSPDMVQGFISRPQQGYWGSHRELLGVVLGSLGKGCRQTGFGPTYPPRRARSQRSLPEAALTG